MPASSRLGQGRCLHFGEHAPLPAGGAWSWWMQRPRGLSPPWRPSSLLPAEPRCVAMETAWQTRQQAEAANSSSGACWSEGGGDGVSKQARLCVCPCVHSLSALCVEGRVCSTLGVSASMHVHACVAGPAAVHFIDGGPPPTVLLGLPDSGVQDTVLSFCER